MVITDIVMPGASGITLLEKVKEKHNADVMVMTGFAEGLKYEEIIEKCVHNFITSHRPYQLAIVTEKALDEIAQNKGIFYDPLVVETCLKVFNQKCYSLNV